MKFIHLPEVDFNNMIPVMNQRIRERLRAAGFTIEDTWKACTQSLAGTDTFCKLPGTCHYMRDKGLQLEFSLTLYDDGESSSENSPNKYTIELSGDEMLVEGVEIDP